MRTNCTSVNAAKSSTTRSAGRPASETPSHSTLSCVTTRIGAFNAGGCAFLPAPSNAVRPRAQAARISWSSASRCTGS